MSSPTYPTKFCTQCGTQIAAMAEICPSCGVRQMAPPPPVAYGGYYPMPPVGKDKTVAGLLGILLGGIGAHKFYLGKVGQGLLYLLFCWTFIPTVIGFIEGIIYLTMSQDSFATSIEGRYHTGPYLTP